MRSRYREAGRNRFVTHLLAYFNVLTDCVCVRNRAGLTCPEGNDLNIWDQLPANGEPRYEIASINNANLIYCSVVHPIAFYGF